MIRSLILIPLVLGFAVPALAQSPREGTYKGTWYSGIGTTKVVPVGKEKLLATFDENGFGVSTPEGGFLDGVTWHCMGMADFTKGTGQERGFCSGTDPSGDQVAITYGPDEKHSLDQKSWKGSGQFTGGTGKYEGITGNFTYVMHANELKAPTEGIFVNYATVEGIYKLPTAGVGSTTKPAAPAKSKQKR